MAAIGFQGTLAIKITWYLFSRKIPKLRESQNLIEGFDIVSGTAKSSVVDFIFCDGLVPHGLLPLLHHKMKSLSPLS